MKLSEEEEELMKAVEKEDLPRCAQKYQVEAKELWMLLLDRLEKEKLKHVPNRGAIWRRMVDEAKKLQQEDQR